MNCFFTFSDGDTFYLKTPAGSQNWHSTKETQITWTGGTASSHLQSCGEEVEEKAGNGLEEKNRQKQDEHF